MVCEPLAACLFPNIPTSSRADDGTVSYECAPFEGFTTIPKDDEITWDFASADVTPECQNGVHDFGETAVDCGGPSCPPCGLGEFCAGDDDSCESGVCLEGACGGYELPLEITAGTAEAALTFDVNGDGNDDLIVATSSPPGVSVLNGNGDGTFTPGGNYPTEGSPSGLAFWFMGTADSTHDILVANGSAGTVSVFEGSTSGTFTSAGSFPAGGNPLDVVVARLDLSDPAPFAVTINSGGGFSTIAGDASTLLGAATVTDLGTAFTGIATAVQVAGRPGIALAGPDGARVLYTSGASGLLDSTAMLTTDAASSIAIADTNGDRQADVIVGHTDSAKVSVWLGDGAGTFTMGPELVASMAPVRSVARHGATATPSTLALAGQSLTIAYDDGRSVEYDLGHDYTSIARTSPLGEGDISRDIYVVGGGKVAVLRQGYVR